MDLPFTTLEASGLRLEPLAEAHREPLRTACAADPDLWERLYSFSMLGEAFDKTWDMLKAQEAAGTMQPYAVVFGGEVVGLTTFLAIDHAHAALEIGSTYYHPKVRGGLVNPLAKHLLMQRAFAGGANRVQYRVDATNARSRAAVTKLGAVFEGILRKDRIVWTGRVRDTAVFSITNEEWPGVRERLDARIAALA